MILNQCIKQANSSAHATDLIALATNGKVNENSLGVKALSDDEMKKVVGGARITHTKNIPPFYQYGVEDNRGTKRIYTAYYWFTLTLDQRYRGDEQVAMGLLNVDDGSRSYEPAVQATFNYLNSQVSVSIIGVNLYNPVYTRSANRHYANELLQENGKQLINQANALVRGYAQNYR